MKSKKHLKRKQRMKAELKQKRQEFKKAIRTSDGYNFTLSDGHPKTNGKYWFALAAIHINNDEEQVYKVTKELFKIWDNFRNKFVLPMKPRLAMVIYQDGDKINYLKLLGTLMEMGEKLEKLLPRISRSERLYFFRMDVTRWHNVDKAEITNQCSFMKEDILGMLKTIVEAYNNQFYLTRYDLDDVFQYEGLAERAREFQKRQSEMDRLNWDDLVEIVAPHDTANLKQKETICPIGPWWRAK